MKVDLRPCARCSECSRCQWRVHTQTVSTGCSSLLWSTSSMAETVVALSTSRLASNHFTCKLLYVHRMKQLIVISSRSHLLSGLFCSAYFYNSKRGYGEEFFFNRSSGFETGCLSQCRSWQNFDWLPWNRNEERKVENVNFVHTGFRKTARKKYWCKKVCAERAIFFDHLWHFSKQLSISSSNFLGKIILTSNLKFDSIINHLKPILFLDAILSFLIAAVSLSTGII